MITAIKQFFKDLIFKIKVSLAIRRANRLARRYGVKYMVIYLNGSIKVVPRRVLRELIAKRRFRKGVTMADIERRAIYETL